MRYFAGRAISQGGRDHTSHRLVAIGLSETTAVVILWSISAAGGAVAYLLYNVGFSYALYFAAIVILGLALFGIVLSRVRVYAEGAEPDGPASAFGFTLPGELVYKRQILWVLLDAVSVVLAINAAIDLVPPAGASPSLASESVPPAATVMIALLAVGLYRWDWMHFGPPLAGRIVTGCLIGVAGGAWLGQFAGAGSAWPVRSLVTAWGFVAGGVCGTRLAIRVIDRWLHLWGRAGG
jgi:UDP-GlcNAc:undecaprenyl-phosphate/decaprenyl-phosphate GlcNAc-1-phosphate transferase